MGIFYHVSTSISHNGIFTPRVPFSRRCDEDNVTKRISVSTSLEKCLTGIPSGGSKLDELNIVRRGYYTVFKINTDKLNIPNEQIITSEKLFKENLVPDADFTDEHWITCSFTVGLEDTKLIKLNDWDEESIDDIPYHIYELAETEKYNGNYIEAYMDVYDKNVPCAVEIINANYTSQLAKKGETINLMAYDDEEIAELKKIINDIYHIEPQIIPGEIYFELSKNCDLKELFLQHAEIWNCLENY